MKRLVLAVVAVTTLLLPCSALAQRAQREIETTPVTFQITSAACPNLPAGTTINGQGTLTSVTWVTKKRGVTTVTNSSVAPGTATDQAGNQYTFVYSNQFRVSNTRSRPRVFSGVMIDVFKLEGAAPLHNGFLAKFRTTFEEGGDRIRPIDAFGDPIDFRTFEARCDPL